MKLALMKLAIDIKNLQMGNAPKEHGWYMVVRKSTDEIPKLVVIQAWYNPAAISKWYVGGGMQSSYSEPLNFQENIVGYFQINVASV